MIKSPSNSEKIALFNDAFRGRDNVIAQHWTRGGRSGYAPVPTPMTDHLVLSHFKGERILGVYPLLRDNSCHFIAADFDNHTGDRNPLQDVKAFYDVCQVQELPCYILKSKSGNGYHAYVFFTAPVPSYKARLTAFFLLQESQIIGDNVELSSFDRLFPNQDELSGKGFGNLIALPFQGKAVANGNTLFLDPGTGFINPFEDQWGVLAKIEKVPESKLNELIAEWKLEHKPINNTTRDTGQVTDAIMECEFIKWCKEEPEKVSEPLWFALISNLVCVRPGGYSLSHELSKGYPGYSQSETNAKIHRALDGPGPHTCEYIQQNGYKCKKVCSVKAPAGLFFNGSGSGDTRDARRIKVSFS